MLLLCETSYEPVRTASSHCTTTAIESFLRFQDPCASCGAWLAALPGYSDGEAFIGEAMSYCRLFDFFGLRFAIT